jgi:hypothetical protein
MIVDLNGVTSDPFADNDFDVCIYNLNGKIIMYGRMSNNSRYNVSNLDGGLYLISVKNGQTMQFQKFIKL